MHLHDFTLNKVYVSYVVEIKSALCLLKHNILAWYTRKWYKRKSGTRVAPYCYHNYYHNYYTRIGVSMWNSIPLSIKILNKSNFTSLPCQGDPMR